MKRRNNSDNPSQKKGPKKKKLTTLPKESSKTETKNPRNGILSPFDYTSSDDELFDKKSTQVYLRSRRNPRATSLKETYKKKSKSVSREKKASSESLEINTSKDPGAVKNGANTKVNVKSKRSCVNKQGKTDIGDSESGTNDRILSAPESETTENGKVSDKENATSSPNDDGNSTSLRKCPICDVKFAEGIAKHKLNEHVNSCLDLETKTAANRQVETNEKGSQAASLLSSISKSDEEFAKELQKREEEKHQEEILSDGLLFCSFCQKDLTNMNSGTRQTHMNKCADMQEVNLSKSRKAEKKLLAKEGGLECYICGLKFSNPKARVSHMKQCSKGKNVSPKVLMDLINSEQSNLPVAENQDQNKRESTNAGNFSGEKSCQQTPGDVNTALRYTLDKGVTARLIQPKRKKVSKLKTRHEEIPALLKRNEEEAKQMLSKKAERFIAEHLDKESLEKTALLFPASGLKMKYIRKDGKQTQRNSTASPLENDSDGVAENDKCLSDGLNTDKTKKDLFLWNLAANNLKSHEVSNYYVRDVFADDLMLIEKINKQNSLEKSDSFDSAVIREEKKSEDPSKLEHAELKIFEKTQNRNFENSLTMTQAEKAEILDKLGEDRNFDEMLGENANSVTSDAEEISNDEMQCSGFYKSIVDTDLSLNKQPNAHTRQATDVLIKDMNRLLASDTNKDVTIRCSDGELRAHSLILMLRCPQLLKDLTNGIICSESTAKGVMQCLLRYLYTGVLDFDADLVEELAAIANRLSLEYLVNVCNEVRQRPETPTDSKFNDKESGDNVNALLKNLWENDDSPENDTEASEAENSDNGSEFDENDAEDLRYFFATQKEKIPSEVCVDDKDKCSEDDDDGIAELLLAGDVRGSEVMRTGSALDAPESYENVEHTANDNASNLQQIDNKGIKGPLDKNVTTATDNQESILRRSPISLLNEKDIDDANNEEKDQIESSICLGNSLNISLSDIPMISAEECSQIQIVQNDEMVNSFLQDLSAQVSGDLRADEGIENNAEVAGSNYSNKSLAGKQVVGLSQDGDSLQYSLCFNDSDKGDDERIGECNTSRKQMIDLSGDGDSSPRSPCFEKNNEEMAGLNSNDKQIVDLSADGGSVEHSPRSNKSEELNREEEAECNLSSKEFVDLSAGDSLQHSPVNEFEELNNEGIIEFNLSDRHLVDLSADGDSFQLSPGLDDIENVRCSFSNVGIEKQTKNANDVIDIDNCAIGIDDPKVEQQSCVEEKPCSYPGDKNRRNLLFSKSVTKDTRYLVLVSPSRGTPKAFENSFATPMVKLVNESMCQNAVQLKTKDHSHRELMENYTNIDRFDLSYIDDDIPSADLTDEAPESPCVASTQYNKDVVTQTKYTNQSPLKLLSGNIVNLELENAGCDRASVEAHSSSESDDVVDVSPNKNSPNIRRSSSFVMRRDETIASVNAKNILSHFNSALSTMTSTPNKRKAVSVDSSDSDEESNISKKRPPSKKSKTSRASKGSKDAFKALVKRASNENRRNSPASSSEFDPTDAVGRAASKVVTDFRQSSGETKRSSTLSSAQSASPKLSPKKSSQRLSNCVKSPPKAKKSNCKRNSPSPRKASEKGLTKHRPSVRRENRTRIQKKVSDLVSDSDNSSEGSKESNHRSFEIRSRSVTENLDHGEENSDIQDTEPFESERNIASSLMYASGILAMDIPCNQEISIPRNSDSSKRMCSESTESLERGYFIQGDKNIERTSDTEGAGDNDKGSVRLHDKDREKLSVHDLTGSTSGESNLEKDCLCPSVLSRGVLHDVSEIVSSDSNEEHESKRTTEGSLRVSNTGNTTKETEDHTITKEIGVSEASENEISWNDEFEADCFIDDGGFNCDIADEMALERPPSRNPYTIEHRQTHNELSHEKVPSYIPTSTTLPSVNPHSLVTDSPVTPGQDLNDTEDSIILSDSDGGDSEGANEASEEDSDARCAGTSNIPITNITTDMQPHVAVTRTPNTALRNFGPGCTKHPETNLTITPMSDYDAMNTPALVKRVKEFGIRKLPKRQMAGKMREIYKMHHGFTHWEEPPPKLQRKKRKDNVEKPKKSAKVSEKDSESKDNESDGYSSSDNRRKSMFEGYLESDTDDEASQSSQTDEEESLSDKLFNFIKNHGELYEKVLTYQKFDFKELYKMVKDAGIKCSKERLIDFLDEQCICFICPRPSQGKTRGRRGRRPKKLDPNNI